MNPHYNLSFVKALAEANEIVVLDKATTNAFNEYGFLLPNIVDCILEIRECDFYKAYEYSGIPHDAYKTRALSLQSHTHKDLYIKFKVTKKVVVVSFHTNTID